MIWRGFRLAQRQWPLSGAECTDINNLWPHPLVTSLSYLHIFPHAPGPVCGSDENHYGLVMVCRGLMTDRPRATMQWLLSMLDVGHTTFDHNSPVLL